MNTSSKILIGLALLAVVSIGALRHSYKAGAAPAVGADLRITTTPQGGTGTSTQPTYDQILIGGSTSGRYDVKTLKAGSNVTIATSSGQVIISSTGGGGGGSGNVATSTNETTGYVPYWTTTSGSPATIGSDSGLQFSAAADRLTTLYASTTAVSVSGAASSTGLTVSGLTSAITLTGADGTFAEYTGTTCTNQFVRSLSALGAATCAAIDLAADVTGTLPVANGGTGATTLTGLLQGNGTSAVTGITGTAGQFPYYNGMNTLIATSTLFLGTHGDIGIGTSTPGLNIGIFTSGAKYLDITTPPADGYASILGLGASSTVALNDTGGIQFSNYANNNPTTNDANSTSVGLITSFVINDYPTLSQPTQNGAGMAFFTKPYTGAIDTTDPAIVISHTGEVGINTGQNLPATALQVVGTASTTALNVSSLTSALTLTGADGAFAEYAGTSCTNQFPRSLSVLGAATCASVSLTADITGTLAVGNGGTNKTSWTAGSVVFAGAGGTALQEDNASFFFNDANNNLGIGTTTPVGLLNLAGASGAPLTLTHTGAGANLKHWQTVSANGAYIVRTLADSLAAASASAKMVILNGGNVGFGTTTPASKLAVELLSTTGTVIGTDALTGFVGTLLDLKVASSTKFKIDFAGNASSTQLSTTNSAYFATAGGKVGIATTSPWSLLSLDRASGVASSSITVAEYRFGDSGNIATSTAANIDCRTSNQIHWPIGASATTLTLTGLIPGQTCRVVVENLNNTAGAITWAVASGYQLYWTGGSAPSQTTTANKQDVWSFLATKSSSTVSVFGAMTPNF